MHMNSRFLSLLGRGIPVALLIAAAAAPAGAAVIGVGAHVGYAKAYDANEGSGMYGAHVDLHLSPGSRCRARSTPGWRRASR